MKDGSIIVIHSLDWKDAFVRLQAGNPQKPYGPGNGNVNCQYYDFSDFGPGWKSSIGSYEKIIVHRTSDGLYSFESFQFRNNYIRLTGNSGAKVNLQYNTSSPSGNAYELFKFKPISNGVFAFESNVFSGYYLQIKGADVTKPNRNGSGQVYASLGLEKGTSLMGLIYKQSSDSYEEFT
jgi:hypothetical protein